MNGEHILYCQARGIIRRVDRLMSLYTYTCAVFFAIAVLLSIILIWVDYIKIAVTMFVLSSAVTGYTYSSLLQRQMQIREDTDNTLSLLRSRWDELRKDPDLLRIFTSACTDSEVDSIMKLKVRMYVATVLDMYTLIIYFINHGYYTHSKEFAVIYEQMIKSFFRYPFMIEVWKSRDIWGKGCIRDEYGESLVYVVDEVIKEIEQEMTKEKTIP